MHDRPSERGRGPSRSALVALALAALAMLATSPAPASLKGQVIGEITLSADEVVDREVRIHVEPAGGLGASEGFVDVSFLASSGLDTSMTDAAAIRLVAAEDARGSFAPGRAIPVDRCQEGCDLRYVVRFSAGPTVLPGSFARYRVDVEFRYRSSFGQGDPALMRVEVDGQASGPVPAIWAVIAGALAVVGGIGLGPAVDARLGRRHRRWPAVALATIAALVVVWTLIGRASAVAAFYRQDALLPLPLGPLGLYAIEPWSTTLLGVLTFGVVRGLRRWAADGGWTLGLGAVALAGLGGLWLSWAATVSPLIQPIGSIVVAAALGALAGIVIGQAWRTDLRTRHDRWWAAIALNAHGILVAGFGYLAVDSLRGQFSWGPQGLLLLIPATLVLLALRRWFSGGRRWLVLFDLVIAAIGLLGFVAWPSSSFIGSPGFAIDDLGVWVATGAALAALVSSLHRMPGRTPPRAPEAPDPPDAAVDPAAPLSAPDPPAPPAADPATT